MAKSPNKKGAKLVVYPRQFPGPGDKKSTPDDSVTPHLGHEYRLTNKFSEETEMEEQTVPGRPKGARETFAKRWRLGRAKHTPHPASLKGGHYKTTPQMERPHYEEYDMNESSMRVWKHKTKDVSVDWNKHGSKYTVHVNGEKVSGHATQDSALEAAKRRARKMDESKTYEQFVTEAAKRGRPRKLRPGEEADTLHIQDQLSKLTHPNHVDVHFKDGTKHQIPREHANKALQHLASLRPIDRADHAEHMGKGHSEFYHVLTKKSIPEKKGKITLAGPKLRKEEAEQIDEAGMGMKAFKRAFKGTGPEGTGDPRPMKQRLKDNPEHAKSIASNKDKLGGMAELQRRIAKKITKEEADHDDGWYAHKEMHGSKAVSKEDWKKGVRLNKDGKRVQMKKEEVEQLDEWGESKVAKGIVGTRASTRQMAATPRTVPAQGRSKKPKKQKLDVTPLQTEEKTGFAKLKASLTSMASKTKKVGGEELVKMDDPMKGKYTQKEVK